MKTPDNMLHLKQHLEKAFEGSLTIEEIARYFTPKQLKLMNEAVQRHANHFKKWNEDGLPFPGDCKVFDKLLKKDEGIQLIQAMYNEFD
jgi:hypothetical protein